MDVAVDLQNQFYPWTCGDEEGTRYFFKGTLFYRDELLDGATVARLLVQISNEKGELETFLQSLNGIFAIILNMPDRTLCIVDRFRSFPIFFGKTDSKLLISDDAHSLRDLLNPSINECNSVEMLVTGYVTGSETLYNGISQIQAGSYLVCEKETDRLVTSYYYRYLHGDFFADTPEVLLDRLDETLVRVFQRLITSTKGLQIFVPLSGGLDSRLVLTMLKRLGVKDVISFSYGNKDWPEAKIAKQVAEALGYPFYYVEYTEQKWHACYRSEVMKAYTRYAGNLASLPYIQDFLAIKELKEDGIIPDNAVFVPGHTDLFPGVFIPHDYDKPRDFTSETLQRDIIKQHYRLEQFKGADGLLAIFNKKIHASVGDVPVFDNESSANALELFALVERTAKLIVNGFRAYEFFGYEWRAPLCDAEIMDYFRRVPVSYRIKKTLYRDYAGRRLFTGTFDSLKRIECTTPIRFSLSSTLKGAIKRSDTLNEIMVKILKPKRRVTEYDKHRYAMWGIISKEDYDNRYSGISYINSFLALSYLESVCPGIESKVLPRIALCDQSSSGK